MIHILKSRSGYRVRYSGKNGEPLAVSEVLTSKANAWKNVRAMAQVFFIKAGMKATVKDEEGVYWILWYWNGKAVKTKCTGGALADLRLKND